jgi:hypothetical protein
MLLFQRGKAPKIMFSNCANAIGAIPYKRGIITTPKLNWLAHCSEELSEPSGQTLMCVSRLILHSDQGQGMATLQS